ncbi:lethal giant larvae like, C-terminal-domain-containing protein [Myxozyma melibiosi]|uniref:Lethal giant larvae like, C-terminal-domain-containing protein n=1 Tax=Myxozyma melibiosi TaxID=54550 RepID=A0ABR1FAY4_9ASCO
MLKLNKSGRDLSSGLTPEAFGLEDLARFGIAGGISVLAFDPIQSLLAAGTDNGRVYVFGQPGVEVEFDLCPGRPIIHLRIIKGIYLVTVDGNNNVTVLSLESRDVLSVFTPSAPVTAVESDPALDWMWLGLDNGLTIVYDVDRGGKTPYRISNLQRTALPRAPASPVVFLAIHPRSYQLMLVGYERCAVVYSMADDDMLLVLQYEVPAGAPGGDLHELPQQRSRFPLLTYGAWHPNGHHIVTAYDDGSFVFWDAKEGKLLQARTVEDTDVNIPRKTNHIIPTSPTSPTYSSRSNQIPVREPIYRLAWCCTTNPEDTSLIIAGGESSELPLRGMTYMDFGPTPAVKITSYAAMGEHYAQPRRQRIYPVPLGADPVDFIMLPRMSPFYAGNMDPLALVAILSSGELYSIEYPTGAALPVAQIFPPSLCWIQPRMTAVTVSAVRREQWVGMMAARKKSSLPPIIIGGAPARSRLRRFDMRNIIATGHSDGYVRLWDASHGEIEDSVVLDMSIADAIGRSVDVRVSHISFAGQMGEISAACETGEMVYFKYGLNRPGTPGETARRLEALNIGSDGRPAMIQHVSDRVDPSVKEGFLPIFVLNPQQGPITAIKNSDIGFLAVGYQFGSLAVVELRSMTLIYLETLASATGDINASSNHGSTSNKKFSVEKMVRSPSISSNSSGNSNNRRSATASGLPPIEVPTAIEFSLMALEGDSYSSIVLSVGTSLGRLLTFRVIPRRQSAPGNSGGQHVVQFVGATQLKSRVLAVIPFDTDYGVSAVASPTILGKLAQGIVINGAVVAVMADEARVIRLPKNKVSSRTFDDKVLVAGLSLLRQGDTLVLTCVTEAGYVRIYALPSLKELTHLSAQKYYDVRYAQRSLVSLNGDVLLGIGKNESALFNIWGKALAPKQVAGSGNATKDALYDVMKVQPPRPTISNLQWMSGVRYISPEDFDLLIGGPHRPRSQREMEEERARREQQRLAATQKIYHAPTASQPNRVASFFTGNASGSGGAGGSRSVGRGGAYGNMSDAVDERGEGLGYVQSQFAKLEEASSDYVKNLSDFLNEQKKSAATSYLKSKFF